MELDLSVYMRIDGFICPPEFWAALGYPGEARWVAIYWEQCGDEAAWADGREAFAGANWPSYLALLRHNFSPGHPYHWLLGASDAQAVFWLVIERETEQAWLVPAEMAEKALRDQWPALYVTAGVAEDWAGVVLDEVVQQQMGRDAANYGALVEALAARPAKWRVVQQMEEA